MVRIGHDIVMIGGFGTEMGGNSKQIKSLFKLIMILIKAEFNLIFNKINFLGEI